MRERQPNHLLTVFADASYTWEDKCAGYAFWARGDSEKCQGSAGITWDVENISEAETIALAEGIFAALERIPLNYGGGIIAQSDSIDALNVYQELGHGIQAKTSDRKITRYTKPNEIQIAFTQRVIDRARQNGSMIFLKHVKAHSGIDVARSRVNAWCDSQAKMERRRMQALKMGVPPAELAEK